MSPSPTPPVDLLSLSPRKLIALCEQAGFTRGKAQNLFRRLHEAPDIPLEDLRGVHPELRRHAAEHWELQPLDPGGLRRQPEDGDTHKLLFETWDSLPVETVLMPRTKGGFTVCVSSQVGCRVGCTFCRTGEMGLERNLTAGEIVDQVRRAREQAEGPIRNVVFMGMGEPLENLDAVLTAIEVLQAPEVYAISQRRITISTSGHLPGIRELGRRAPRVNLALSLNAPEEELRRQIMPISRRYPLADLLAELRRFPLPRSATFMIEYVLFAGLNDEPHHAHALRELLGDLPCKVNLIAYNPVPGLPYERPDRSRLEAFREALGEVGQGVVQRYSWGGGIDAACGQLGAQVLERRREGESAAVPAPRVAPWSTLEV